VFLAIPATIVNVHKILPPAGVNKKERKKERKKEIKNIYFLNTAGYIYDKLFNETMLGLEYTFAFIFLQLTQNAHK
jgi:hypothetical protein